jgi:hypothetical protein
LVFLFVALLQKRLHPIETNELGCLYVVEGTVTTLWKDD